MGEAHSMHGTNKRILLYFDSKTSTKETPGGPRVEDSSSNSSSSSSSSKNSR
jgi:hypothetical protein